MTALEEIAAILETKKDLIFEVSDKIWEYAELSYNEFQSAKKPKNWS